MTRIWYDCEFLDDGRMIGLISIGVVAEDGREYYAVNGDAPWERIKKYDWLLRNVVPSLPITGRRSLDAYLKTSPNSFPRPSVELVGVDTGDSRVRPHWVIANEVRDFIQATPDPELWAWYGAYDHVALCQLWGRMIHLPPGVPEWTNDLQQEVRRLGDPAVPEQVSERHNALADARHLKVVDNYLAHLARSRSLADLSWVSTTVARFFGERQSLDINAVRPLIDVLLAAAGEHARVQAERRAVFGV